MRLTLLAVVAGAFVALAGEPPAAAKDDKAPAAPGEDKTLIIENGKGAAETKKSATGTDTGKKALIIQNGKGAKAKKK
jgi:hypothetical protein